MLLNDFSDDLISSSKTTAPQVSKKSWGIPLRLSQPKKQRKGMSLRTKATLWALALGTLPVIGVGSGAYLLANRAARQEIQLTQQAQANQVAVTLNQFMTERYSDIEMLANLPNLKKIQTKKAPLSLAEQQTGLQQLKDNLKIYQSISIFSLEGEVLLQTEGAESVNPVNQSYFQIALKTNQPTISELTTIESVKSAEGESVVYFTAPIKDATTGKPIALIRTQMPVKAIEEVVQSWGKSGDEYRISDRNGKVFLTNANDRLASTLKIAQDQRLTRTAITPELANLPQLDWQVVFAGNVRSMMESQRNLQLLIASSTLLTAMLVSAIAVTLASFATRPLQDAAEAVEELGKGKFNTRLKVRGRDELGILGDNINRMASQLEDSIQYQTKAAESAEALNLIASNMRQSLSEREVLNATVNDLRQSLKTDRIVVYQFDTDWCGTIVAESAVPGCKKIFGEKVTDPMREGFIERYRNGRVRAMNDIYAEDLTECHETLLQDLGIKASITAPVLKQGKLVGLLCAHECKGPRAWDRTEVELVRQVSAQLGFALDQAYIFQKQIRSAQSSDVLNHILNRMRQSLTRHDVMNNAVQEVRQAFNTDRVIIYEFKNDWCGTIVAESVANGYRRTLGEDVTDPMREGLIERYRDGRVRSMDDIYAEGLTDCHKELLEGFQIRASITAPVLIHGKLVGLLCIHHCSGPRAWQEEDIELFRQLTMQLGFTLDQAELLERQTLNATRSQLISDAVATMRRTLDETSIMRVDRVIVYFFNKEFTSGTIVAESVMPGYARILNRKINDPLLPECIEKFRDGGYSIINNINAVEIAPCHREILSTIQVQANLVVPMISEGELIGLMGAHQCSGPREWEEQDILLMRQLGMQVGYALDQAALLRRQQRAADRWQLFTDTIVQMRKSTEVPTVLQTAVEQALTFLKVDRVVVHMFATDWKSGNIVAESVVPGFMQILNRRITDPLSLECLEKFRRGGFSELSDVNSEDLAPCHREILQSIQVQANLVVPIVSGGNLLGLLAAHQCSSPRNWETQEVDMFRQLGLQLGFALDQATLISDQKRSGDRWKIFTETIVQFRKSLDFNTILQSATEQSLTFLKVDRVVVHRFDPDFQSGAIVAESVVPGFMRILNRRIDDPLLPSCIEKFQEGGYSFLNDVTTDKIADCHRAILQGIQVQANIVAPIIRNGELIGLLAAQQCRSARQWDSEEIELFRQIAIQLGFALDQSYLLTYAETARQEARADADAKAEEQRVGKEFLQKRAMELLMEVDPVSQGDLTIRAKVTPDEVGTIADSYNAIIQSLCQIVTQVQEASTSVATTASDNAEAVESLSQETSEQKTAIADAMREVQAMVHSIQGVVSRAQKAERGVQTANEAIADGDNAMNQTVEGISLIRETVAETSKKVKRLGEASQRISKVVSLISEFAAQTNLLALNAAIEAARAGEEGRGFGVVAEEVRNLAQQSTRATAEIEQLVQEIQAQTHEVVLAMDAGTEQVVLGTQLVETSRQKLTQIGEVSHEINQLVREISHAATAQTTASSKVSRSMEQVSTIANQTAARSSGVAESFESLLAVAENLQVSVAKFKVK
jgi:methyl-accepting chemotaxis protein PixJ